VTENDEFIGMITDRDIAIGAWPRVKARLSQNIALNASPTIRNMIEALTPSGSDQALRLVRDRKPPPNSRPAPVQP
jgi:hypothetical protein